MLLVRSTRDAMALNEVEIWELRSSNRGAKYIWN